MAEIIETVVESSHNEVKSDMAAKTSKERLDYIRDYDRANRLKVGGYLNRLHEPELCEYWESIPNKSDWIRRKLREDLERQKAGK